MSNFRGFVKRKPKVHYIRLASYLSRSLLCGTSSPLVTRYKNEITCKTCLRLAEKLHEQLIENAGVDGEYGRDGYYG